MNKIEIFSANCQFCQKAISKIKEQVCADCDVSVLDIHDESVAKKAKELGVKRVPSIVVNGQLLPCCECQEIKLNL